MIEVKATTTNDNTEVEVKVNADFAEYGAEVLSIIHTVMGALKRDDTRLHAAVLKAIADEPSILFGEDISVKSDSDIEAKLANAMSKAIIRKGVN